MDHVSPGEMKKAIIWLVASNLTVAYSRLITNGVEGERANQIVDVYFREKVAQIQEENW